MRVHNRETTDQEISVVKALYRTVNAFSNLVNQALLVGFRERVAAEMRRLRRLGRSLFRRVGDPGFDPGRVNVLEVVVLEDGRQLRGQSVEAEVPGLAHHPEWLLLHHWDRLARHHEGLLLEVVLREQDLVGLENRK